MRGSLIHFVIACFIVATANTDGRSALAQQRPSVPLTSVGLVASIDTVDEDDPGTGGGWETGTYFQTRLATPAAIQACMDPVEQAAVKWATPLGLARSLRDRNQSYLSLHYTKPGVAGFFAISYRLEQQVKARVRVDFVILDGTPTSPELARDLLEKYQIAALQAGLDAAMRCGGKAS